MFNLVSCFHLLLMFYCPVAAPVCVFQLSSVQQCSGWWRWWLVTSGPGDDKWDAIIALHSHLICSISPSIIINITNQNRNDSCNMQCFVLILLANDILPFNIYNFPYIGCFIFDIIIFHSQVINLKLKVSVCLLYHYRILGSALQLLYKEFSTKIFF